MSEWDKETLIIALPMLVWAAILGIAIIMAGH